LKLWICAQNQTKIQQNLKKKHQQSKEIHQNGKIQTKFIQKTTTSMKTRQNSFKMLPNCKIITIPTNYKNGVRACPGMSGRVRANSFFDTKYTVVVPIHQISSQMYLFFTVAQKQQKYKNTKSSKISHNIQDLNKSMISHVLSTYLL
jgi:hypothetical protein